ncbi:MAG: hypothetical protein K0R23_2970 [Lacrimispora sp.]|nr:hypothetical protein [Lacrimispora sp.]
MKKMKRIQAAALASVMALSLTAWYGGSHTKGNRKTSRSDNSGSGENKDQHHV